MRIVMIATGLWGDVRPNVVLGQALKKAGNDVVVVATAPYQEWIEARGLTFAPVSLDMQGMLNLVMGGDGGVLGTIRALNTVRKDIQPTFMQAGKEVAAVMRDGDVLLADELVSFLLNGVVEKYRPRLLHVNMQPQAITSEFAAIGQPTMPNWMPMRRAYNRLSYGVARRTTWSMQGSVGNKIRSAHLGLPKQTWVKQKELLNSTPTLVLASRHLVPPPADWPSHHYVTGFLFDDESDWQAPPELLEFLAAGEKPICIGFGTMPMRKPIATTMAILDAVRRSGRRAILLGGWDGIGTTELPKGLFRLKYAPHSWLLPRIAAMVHHGGAGTVAAAVRAGVPSVIVPFTLDQPFWGQRLFELGVSTKPIPRSKLTAEKLEAAIKEATTSPAMQHKVTELSKKIVAEDGVGEAMKMVSEFLA
jgi:sterol 3beta-glucosyltransferase